MTGKDIVKVRLALNLSQKSLAKIFNISTRTIQRWETMETIPNLASLAVTLYLRVIDLEHRRK